MARDLPIIPDWRDDVPWCNESCPKHDGKRCEVLGRRPDDMCVPAVRGLVATVRGVYSATGDWWDSTSTVEAIRRAIGERHPDVPDLVRRRR